MSGTCPVKRPGNRAERGAVRVTGGWVAGTGVSEPPGPAADAPAADASRGQLSSRAAADPPAADAIC